MKKLSMPIKNYDITITDAVYNIFEKDRNTIFEVAIMIMADIDDNIDDKKCKFVDSNTCKANDIAFDNKTGIIHARYFIDFNFLIVLYNINNGKVLIYLENEIQ